MKVNTNTLLLIFLRFICFPVCFVLCYFDHILYRFVFFLLYNHFRLLLDVIRDLLLKKLIFDKKKKKFIKHFIKLTCSYLSGLIVFMLYDSTVK